MAETRIERDALGEVEVPADVYYGAQTARARDNFPVSGRPLAADVVHALGELKEAAARVNGRQGRLTPEQADAIARAAREVAEGRHDRDFVVDVFQTGSGTSSHMNANEVIARRANELLTGRRHSREPVHPNDHVNRGQSSNDVFPTAVHLAVLRVLRDDLDPALAELQGVLAERARAFDGVVKLGRTHLQDALPVRLGQEFAGYARMVERGREGLEGVRPVLEETALGGTAVGTGHGAPAGFAGQVLEEVNRQTGLGLRVPRDRFEALGSRHALVAASGTLKTAACDLMKIANDLRLLSSGPRGGWGEIVLPALQPGSSMMPGKVNPVIPEVVCQVAAQVIGHDAAVTVGGQSGLLELNVMMPMMADNVLTAARLLASAARLLARKCVAGIEARPDRCREWVSQSLALATALVPVVGYDAAARLAHAAHREGLTLREVVLRDTDLAAEAVDRLLDPGPMAGGPDAAPGPSG